MSKSGEYEYIECVCSCACHNLRFSWDPDPSFPKILVSVFLNSYYGFFRRIWLAIRYIFGFKSKYGQFDEVILMNEQVEQLENMCDRFLKTHMRKSDTLKNSLKWARLVVDLRKKELAEAENELNNIWAEQNMMRE